MQASAKRWIFWLTVALLLFVFLHAIKAILLPFVVGILVAYFLDPAADRLEALKLPRPLATAIITLSFFAVLVVLGVTLVPLLMKQMSGLLAILPHYVQELQTQLDAQVQHWMGALDPSQLASAKEAVSNVSSEIFASLGGVVSGVLKSGFAVINLISLLVITPVVSFYLLRDWDKITHCLNSLLPPAYAGTIREQVQLIDQTLAGFMRGTLNVMMTLGAFYAIALSIAGLEFAVLIGMLSGALIIIPYLGTIISGLSAVGIAYLQHEGNQLVIAVGCIFVLGQILEGYVLTPKLVGEKVGLHPLWLIFGMLAGASLFGFVGVFLAVPVSATIGVLVRFAIAQYRHSSYYHAS